MFGLVFGVADAWEKQRSGGGGMGSGSGSGGGYQPTPPPARSTEETKSTEFRSSPRVSPRYSSPAAASAAPGAASPTLRSVEGPPPPDVPRNEYLQVLIQQTRKFPASLLKKHKSLMVRMNLFDRQWYRSNVINLPRSPQLFLDVRYKRCKLT